MSSIQFFLGHQTMNIHWRFFIFSLALVLGANRNARDPVEIVAGIFPWAAYQKMFFLIHEIVAVVLTHFKIVCELDRISRAGFFTESTENAT